MISTIKLAILHWISMVVPQKEASILSDSSEFWSAEDSRSQDFSHWRGKGRWTDERWFGIGLSTYQLLKETLDKYSSWTEPGYERLKVLELGSGGGANIVELCRHFGAVYGADISSPNLDECNRQANLLGGGGVNSSLYYFRLMSQRRF